jgi:hypothetical protein
MKGRNLTRARRKLKRLKEREARPRALRRQSAKVSRLMTAAQRRILGPVSISSTIVAKATDGTRGHDLP